MHHIDIFSTPLWIFKREVPEGMYEWALKFEKETPSNIRKSNRGGYQSDAYGGVKNLPIEYQNYIKDALYELPRFNFNNWWLNINCKYDYNVPHTHPYSDLAVVWNITDNHGLLNLRDINAHNRSRLVRALGINDVYNINARAGTIIVFPSDILHYVTPHESETSRINIAMNLDLVI
tara:strand:+ start:50 stop:580 length:531 start_codon:yes stop_codon:yes gene_type:complete